MTDSVLITGSSTGFGLETALQLAARGFRVYATMRDLSYRADVEAAASRRGVVLHILRLDVTEPDSIRQAVDTVVAESGGIFGIVNNAGLLIRGYFEDLDDAEVRQVFETNLFGTMAVTRAVLPHMRHARRGSSAGNRTGSCRRRYQPYFYLPSGTDFRDRHFHRELGF